jgi:hypothetical protein
MDLTFNNLKECFNNTIDQDTECVSILVETSHNQKRKVKVEVAQ